MEFDICLRKALLSEIPMENDPTSQSRVLLGCHLCKAGLYKQISYLLENESEQVTPDKVSRYEVLLLWPLILSFTPEKNRYTRTKTAVLLTVMGLNGEKIKTREETISQIQAYIETVKNSVKQKNQADIEFVHTLSLADYSQMASIMYEVGDFGMLRILTMSFWYDRIKITGGGCRRNIYYVSEYEQVKEFLLPIGVSLNEGLTETATVVDMNEFMRKIFPDNNEFQDDDRISDAYFFEIMFYRNVCSLLNIDAKDYAVNTNKSDDIMRLLFESNRTGNLCKVYELLSASDDLDWAKAQEVLDSWNKE